MTIPNSSGLVAVIAWMLLVPVSAHALILIGFGNEPVPDSNWRAGSIDVANLKCRVAFWEGPPLGGGEWHFLYRSDTAIFNEALKVFAKVRAPSLELIVCDGPGEASFLKNDKDPKSSNRYDWDFVIWNVQSFYQMYGNPKGGFRPDDPNFRQPLPPPRISVYIGGGGGVEWDKVEIPKGITVIDRRAATAGVKPGQGAVIAGNVFDMSTGKPLSGAKILAFVPMNSGMAFRLAEGKMPIPEYEKAFADKSDDQGRFRVEKISAGSYRVSVSAPGYAALLASYAKIATDGYLGLDDVELAPAVSVTGTVTDEGEKPIAGATVRVDDILGMNGQSYRLPASAQATSDADGHFQITGLPQGYGRLFCFAKNYYAPLGEQRALPATDVVIRMIKTGAIKGKVAGDVQGRANNVSVEPEGQRIGKWGGGMQIGPDGTFRFDGVPPGTYYVTLGASYSLSDPTVQAKAKRITVVSGETVEVELTP